MMSARMIPEQLSKPRRRVSFRNRLLRWYDSNHRDLPWRQTKDPYRIWLSEIMLQQTRVGAVIDHYHRFLQRFPDIYSLARAREQSVLAAWSGLGYYRRARNLHACAKMIVSERGGKFPTSASELQELPGIGQYTSAAIASIAFDAPHAVVDGNVERVLQRVTGNAELSKRHTWELAHQLLAASRPGDFNQAMMELGATVCLPREPKCLICPVMKYCAARGSQARDKREQRSVRAIAVGLLQQDKAVWLTQRPKHLSLMPGMWELPEIASNGHSQLAVFKHSILATDYQVTVVAATQPDGKGRWIPKSRLAKMALTGLSRKILRHFAML